MAIMLMLMTINEGMASKFILFSGAKEPEWGGSAEA